MKIMRAMWVMGLAVSLSYPASGEEPAWQELFDGKFPVNFRGYKQLHFPYNAWAVRAGNLFSVAGNDRSDLVVRQPCTNFEFTIEYRLPAGASAGIVYLVQEGTARAAVNGLKMTLADDDKNPDAKTNPLFRSGALHGILPGKSLRLKPAGQWNAARILVRDGHVEHWINNEKALEYALNGEEFEAALKRNRIRNLPDFNEITEGYIALEHPGVAIYFRNPRLRILPAKEIPAAEAPAVPAHDNGNPAPPNP